MISSPRSSSARALIDGWGGKLVLVYLPSRLRYIGFEREQARLEEIKQAVLGIAERLGLPVIDVHAAFGAHNDPTTLYAGPNWRYNAHLTVEGYRRAAETVLKGLDGLADGDGG